MRKVKIATLFVILVVGLSLALHTQAGSCEVEKIYVEYAGCFGEPELYTLWGINTTTGGPQPLGTIENSPMNFAPGKGLEASKKLNNPFCHLLTRTLCRPEVTIPITDYLGTSSCFSDQREEGSSPQSIVTEASHSVTSRSTPAKPYRLRAPTHASHSCNHQVADESPVEDTHQNPLSTRTSGRICAKSYGCDCASGPKTKPFRPKTLSCGTYEGVNETEGC